MAFKSNFRWDLAVNDDKGQLVLVVEIKRRLNTSPEWAAQFRRNILAHETFPKIPYFLMVFPDKFYLWTSNNEHLDLDLPHYIINANSILKPYFERLNMTVEKIAPQSFELMISSWLSEVIYAGRSPVNDDSQGWLVDSGLYAALIGGQFQYEAAA
jgi:hypothetical protein